MPDWLRASHQRISCREAIFLVGGGLIQGAPIQTSRPCSVVTISAIADGYIRPLSAQSIESL